jgi:2-polyprenyl-3-methyl-5-hydroxy-6-metoxy-1,4-benzoquinol methylase
VTAPDPRASTLRERLEYVPQSRQEEFIVPLLAKHIAGALTEYAEPKGPGGVAIDVGCGGQPLRSDVEALGYRYIGVDPWPTPGVPVDHEWAIDAPGVPAEVLLEDGYQLVLCTEVLEHVPDWGAAFTNLRQLAAPGGRLLVTCPAVYLLHEEPQDFWRPTDHALRYFAERHGLAVVHAERLGDAFDVIGTLLGGTELFVRSQRRTNHYVRRVAARLKHAAFEALQPESFFRRRVRPAADVYLSNLMVLERPATD